MLKVLGIILVLVLALFFSILTWKSKGKDLYKWIFIFIFIAFTLTWILPNGTMQGLKFVESGMSRLGLNDIPIIYLYAIYFGLSTIIFLLTLGGLYGVLKETKGYQTLVKKMTKTVEKNYITSAIIIMLLLFFLTSIFRITLPTFVFIPLLVTVLLGAKFDKTTTMAITFGSILAGTIGATYGTEGLFWFNNYMQFSVTSALKYRLVFAGLVELAFVLFVVIKLVKSRKTNKPAVKGIRKTKTKEAKNVASEKAEDLFAVEMPRSDAKIWPILVLLIALFVIVVIGFVDWKTNFNLLWFEKLHEWFMSLKFGKDFTIFKYILGSADSQNLVPGSWEISSLTIILLIFSLVIAIINRMKLNDFASNFADGCKKMMKPISLYVMAYTVFIICYMTQIFAGITAWAWGLTKNFNAYIVAINAFVTSIFHADLGYTGYLIGPGITVLGKHVDITHTIYVITYGLAHMFIPTSGLLLIGLSYLDINYKSWIKYIWLFMLIIIAIFIIFIPIAQAVAK
ncbi:MAG: hypothetical protein GX951_03405 [Mollicutes bacterium]|nr:hypothetical protein [Mollicutes bacterium]